MGESDMRINHAPPHAPRHKRPVRHRKLVDPSPHRVPCSCGEPEQPPGVPRPCPRCLPGAYAHYGKHRPDPLTVYLGVWG
jgi:hypothetical protein